MLSPLPTLLGLPITQNLFNDSSHPIIMTIFSLKAVECGRRVTLSHAVIKKNQQSYQGEHHIIMETEKQGGIKQQTKPKVFEIMLELTLFPKTYKITHPTKILESRMKTTKSVRQQSSSKTVPCPGHVCDIRITGQLLYEEPTQRCGMITARRIAGRIYTDIQL